MQSVEPADELILALIGDQSICRPAETDELRRALSPSCTLTRRFASVIPKPRRDDLHNRVAPLQRTLLIHDARPSDAQRACSRPGSRRSIAHRPMLRSCRESHLSAASVNATFSSGLPLCLLCGPGSPLAARRPGCSAGDVVCRPRWPRRTPRRRPPRPSPHRSTASFARRILPQRAWRAGRARPRRPTSPPRARRFS